MLFQTTEAHEALRKEIRAFAEKEVKPIAFSLDQHNQFPDEIVREMGNEAGWGFRIRKNMAAQALM